MAQRSTLTTAWVRYWKKLGQASAPARVAFDPGADVHQHLVEQHQRCQTFFLWFRQQIHHEWFRRWRVSLLVLPLAVDERQSFRSRQLKGEHAPWMSEHPDRPIGTRRHDAFFQVDLVETQGRDPCLRSLEPGVRLEFFHGWQVGQSSRILHEMPERNERVGLATTIVDGKFAVGPVAPAGQAQNHVPDQFTQIVGWDR